jgi:hypothetical protein
MQKLRSVHLYLGCIFAPLLVFFAVSGIWQLTGTPSQFLRQLSTIHTEVRWKNDDQLGSLPLWVFSIVMAVSFVITTILGVVMAFKFGRSRKAAIYCLTLGVFLPTAMVLYRMFQISGRTIPH